VFRVCHSVFSSQRNISSPGEKLWIQLICDDSLAPVMATEQLIGKMQVGAGHQPQTTLRMQWYLTGTFGAPGKAYSEQGFFLLLWVSAHPLFGPGPNHLP
jgi:hypothetical protein